jgi:hypothetical protein
MDGVVLDGMSAVYACVRSADGSYVYRRNSTSAQNYHVALRLVRARCRIYIFPKRRWNARLLFVVRIAKRKRDP